MFKYYVSVLGVGGSDSNVKSLAEIRKIIHEHSPLCIPFKHYVSILGGGFQDIHVLYGGGVKNLGKLSCNN